jgi:hypothetical protein
VTAYRNLIPGDQTSEVIPAILIGDERVTKFNADSLGRGIDRIKRDLKDREDELAAIQAKCQHHVFEDTAGFPYDVRHCHLCGKYMGQL